MGQFYNFICQPETLTRAFNHLKSANGLWDSRCRAQAVRADPVLPMLRIMHDLAQGTYRPGTAVQFEIERGDGSRRSITCFQIRDRLVQRACLLAIQDPGERLFLPCSYGFRPGLSVDMACARVREWAREGRHWIADADIYRCFDNIPRQTAIRLLAALTMDDMFCRLVGGWLPSENEETRGLPQGMALSPFLCNLYLHSFDLAMRRAGIPMVRYADDFVLLLKTQREAQAAMSFAEQRLKLLRLAIHPRKSRVIKSSPRHRFLGKRLPEVRTQLRAA